MRRLLLLLFLVPSASSAQDGAQGELRAAALAGNEARVEQLVGAHRLEVKPAVQALVRQFAAGADVEVAIAMLAETFFEEFGERSLRTIAAQVVAWDRQSLVLKARADSLFEAGVDVRTDDRQLAQERFDAALGLYQELDDRHGLAEVLGQLGYVSFYLDRESYLENNLAALEARRAVDDRQLIGNTLYDLGLAYRGLVRDYDKALEVFNEARAIREEIGDSLGLSRLIPNIGLTYESKGEYLSARDLYVEGAEMYLAVGDTARWIRQRNNTAGLLTNYAGRHTEAMQILMDLEEDLKLTDDPRTHALVMNLKGIVRRRLGDVEGAVDEYQQLIEIARANELDDLLASAYNNLSVVFILLGRPERAIPLAQRALDAWPEDDPGRLTYYLTLGSAHFEMRNYEEAEHYKALADGLAASAQDRALVQQLDASVKVYTGRAEEALASYDSLLTIADALSSPELRSAAYFGMGDAAERLGRVDDALGHYELAAATLEEERGRARSEEDKAGILAQTRYLYEEIIHFLTMAHLNNPSAGYGSRAFQFAERGKSRAFLDQMAEALADVDRGVDPELQSDLQVLAQNMAYLRGELATTNPREDPERVGELKDVVAQMEGEYERVEREMRERNPRFAAVRYPDPINVGDLQAQVLKPDEVFLQYALGDSSSTLWVVSPEKVAVFQLPPRSELEPQIELLRLALQDPGRSVEGPASRLFDTLVAPALDMINAAEQVILAPDGALHYVPFEALVMARRAGDEIPAYFILHRPMSYVQSASVLRRLRQEQPAQATRELLAVGDPAFDGALEASFLRGEPLARLPFSGEEVRNIAGLFSEVDVLTGEAATEQAVLEALDRNSYRFVHFATHGLLNDERPDYSGLALAGSGTDALLQASEIFNLDIQAELVVLSACETGLGQLVKGEGMVGLTRAFMYAGAPSVAVSLWSVSDASTSLLMRYLYRSLKESSITKANALRQAKLQLIGIPDTAHPFHWAPFVLVGRGD